MMQSEDLLRIAYLIAAFLVPLIPALLLYKLLPSQSDVSGPFKGLTIKLTGAFGGYFLLVLLAFAFAYFVLTPAKASFEVWEVIGTIKTIDEDGKPTSVLGTTLTIQPPNFVIDSAGNFTATVMAKPGHVEGRRVFPQLHFARAGHESAIRFVSEQHVQMDERTKRATFKNPIELKSLPQQSVEPASVR